ncbi:MAG: ElyC/SanA/YdcF family protein [Acidobacteriota bacterium]|nr:ElyC/SanA/YdcF family protein [Acidobacteriota bacterium]
MEFVKRSVELMVSPLGIASMLLAVGVLLSVVRRHARTGRRFLFCGGMLFLIILFSPLSRFLVWNLERQYPPMMIPPATPKVEKILILAGYADYAPHIPVTSNVSAQTMASLCEGIRLFRLMPHATLVVSGGVAKKGERPVAAAMADFLQQLGVPKESVVIEGISRNTYENFLETKPLIGSSPFILVASGCDMRRAVAVAKKLQMKPIPASANIWTLQRHPGTWTLVDWAANYFQNRGYISVNNIARLQWAYHEYLGYIWYRFLERI